ncbi:hypothetical protein WBG06_07460 [Nocardioides sp. CCNWLW239]|uniref:hypothetical protein n=1 Tax=Nocardioides sp. CCNWLW239 TaxID=3128902 RepID=UPI0030174825
MSFRPSDGVSRYLRGHVFVDETKSKDYVVAAATLPAGQVSEARKALRSVLLPRQDRVHFAKEKDPYRARVLQVMCGLDVQVTVYVAKTKDQRVGRAACMNAVIDDVIKDRTAHVVIERDESLMRADLELIARKLYPMTHKPTYRLEVPRSEPLLWISDAVCWCYQRGGAWIDAAQPLVVDVRHLEV